MSQQGVIECLATHATSARAAAAGLRAVLELAANNPPNKARLGSFSGCKACVEALRLHPSNPVVAEYGCWAVVILGSSTVNKETLGLAGACAAIYQACKAHPLNEKVFSKAAWAVSNLLWPGDYPTHKEALCKLGMGVLLEDMLAKGQGLADGTRKDLTDAIERLK